MTAARGALELRDARLVKTTVDPRDPPVPQLPEIAFVGRSNVGKSSLLNTLTGRKRLAYTSRTPGKTRTINYFAVGDGSYLVDLPGYGYARVPERVRRAWRPMIEAYVDDNPRLRGVVALVDGRHVPTRLDRGMIGWLAERRLPTIVVLTKADRVPRGARGARYDEAREVLGLDPEQLLWFSSRSGEGRKELEEAVKNLLDNET
ncbi:MAG: ribosome biogenesis GTP-binding protein YihA/YsxC [Gemmatimonadota bacterium]